MSKVLPPVHLMGSTLGLGLGMTITGRAGAVEGVPLATASFWTQPVCSEPSGSFHDTSVKLEN